MSIFNSISRFIINLYKPRLSNTDEVLPLKPDELYDALAKSIVQSSLSNYDSIIDDWEHNIQYLGLVGAEVMYFLLHIFDSYLFQKYGPKNRDEIFDKVSLRAIAYFGKGLLNIKSDIPQNTVESVCVSMVNTLNDRQDSYSKCETTYYKDGWEARPGSRLFALSFYINKAIEKTEIKDLDEDTLRGKKICNISDNRNFPDLIDTSKIYLFAMIKMINITECWNTLFNHSEIKLKEFKKDE